VVDSIAFRCYTVSILNNKGDEKMKKTYRATGKRWPIRVNRNHTRDITNTGTFTVNKGDSFAIFATHYINGLQQDQTQAGMTRQARFAHSLFDMNGSQETHDRKASYWFSYALKHGVIEEVA
jgi:hypothetical protein